VRQEELEARAKELSAQVRAARPTDPGEMAAQLRWLARELSEEGWIGEQYAAALKLSLPSARRWRSRPPDRVATDHTSGRPSGPPFSLPTESSRDRLYPLDGRGVPIELVADREQ
jgi:hypothetical protein